MTATPARAPDPDATLGALLDTGLPVGGAEMSIRALLTAGLSGTLDDATGRLLARFVEAGRAELVALAEARGWHQLDLGIAGAVPRDLYRAMSGVMGDMLGSGRATDAFFMHKPPGIRLRLQAAVGHEARMAERLREAGAGWQRGGLVRSWRLSRYEPEVTLFGGAEAMDRVHGLFTQDAAIWTALHARPSAGSVLPVSLYLLRALFEGLGIVDWEDLDVWAKVRAMGRDLGAGRAALAPEAMAELFDGLLALWTDPALALRGLDAEDRTRVTEAAATMRGIAALWRGCLDAATTSRTPRAAAALYVIFLWNRAGLTRERQMLVAEALATRRIPF